MRPGASPLIVWSVLSALPPSLWAAADASAAGQLTLAEFVRSEWRIPDFKPGRDELLATVALRVSTYSSPHFIHRGQVERLGDRASALRALCERQGGRWDYVGMPTARRGSEAAATAGPRVDPAAYPTTPEGAHALVRDSERQTAEDVLKATVRAMMRAPDPLTASAIEDALRNRWLGRFECKGDTEAWTAAISYRNYAARKEPSGLTYRDVTLGIELAPTAP